LRISRKKKNRSKGGFGRVFIGSRLVVVGRAVHNGGRDVELVVAVAVSRASTVAKTEMTLSSLLSTRSGTRAGLGCLRGLLAGLWWWAAAAR
jgi:hypothetical protein